MAQDAQAGAEAYTVDLAYPSSFVLGQTPLQLQWAACTAGASPRHRLDESFSYCDLGCGDGSTLALIAACYPDAAFVGVDMNPAHIEIGRDRAARAGLGNLRFVEAGFDRLEALDEERFDYIVAYGIYSWLSPPLMQAIDDFVSRRLAPGGLFAVHYSSLPGSAVHDPLSQALRLLAAARSGGSAERFSAATAALHRLTLFSSFFAQNPRAGELLDGVGDHPLAAVAHDVLNRRSHSFWFVEVASRLADAGLEYVASANVLPDFPELLLPRPAHAAFAELANGADPALGELLKDLMHNSALRFDLYRKPDTTAPGTGAGLAALGALHLTPAAAGTDPESRRRISQRCAVDLGDRLFTIVLELAAASAPTIAELLAAPELGRFARPEVERAVRQLFALGLVNALVRPPRPATCRRDRPYRLSTPLNAIRLEETLLSPRPEGLASPVLGSPLLIPAGARRRLMALTGFDPGRIGTAQDRERIRSSLPRFIAEAVPELLRLGILEADD